MHSLHGYFVRPGDPTEPIEYAVERSATGGRSPPAAWSPSSTASRSSRCRRPSRSTSQGVNDHADTDAECRRRRSRFRRTPSGLRRFCERLAVWGADPRGRSTSGTSTTRPWVSRLERAADGGAQQGLVPRGRRAARRRRACTRRRSTFVSDLTPPSAGFARLGRRLGLTSLGASLDRRACGISRDRAAPATGSCYETGQSRAASAVAGRSAPDDVWSADVHAACATVAHARARPGPDPRASAAGRRPARHPAR